MAAKLYTIVYRYMGTQIRTHTTYSKESHEKELSYLNKNRCCEILEVKEEKRK